MNEKVFKLAVLGLLVVAIVALLLIPQEIDINMAGGEEASNVITVSANGEIQVKPDVAYIELGVEISDPDAKVAADKNNEIMNATMDKLVEIGIPREDLKTTNYSIYKSYDYRDEMRSEEFVVRNTIKVTIKDLSLVPTVLDEAIGAGVNNAYNIHFDVLDKDALYEEALAAAIKKARAKADVMAEAMDVKIDGIVRVNEQSYSYPSYGGGVMYDRAESAAPIEAGDMSVTATVQVIFEY